MKWNWQQPDWPEFRYDESKVISLESDFRHHTGHIFGAYRHLSESSRDLLRVELISNEAIRTSEIEGEFLDRDSLQSSIRRHLGLQTDHRQIPPAEAGISDLMMDVFEHFQAPLSRKMLFDWHQMLMNGRTDLEKAGSYRTDASPMQIISGPLHEPKVHFEAPPSARVEEEMNRFINWFNHTSDCESSPLQSAVARAGIAHLYFESIHPFGDGNGRLGRALAEKALAQALGQPTLIALAAEMLRNRKQYYAALAAASQDNEITDWLEYFGNTVLNAISDTRSQIVFLIEKGKLFERVKGMINGRQEKCLLRMFQEGHKGFAGGLSAKNYMSITGTLRATATRDLNGLIEKGALFKKGERKSTRYYLNIDSPTGQ